MYLEAKKHNLPPFVVFLENSLQDMATMYPTTLEELEKMKAKIRKLPHRDLVGKLDDGTFGAGAQHCIDELGARARNHP